MRHSSRCPLPSFFTLWGPPCAVAHSETGENAWGLNNASCIPALLASPPTRFPFLAKFVLAPRNMLWGHVVRTLHKSPLYHCCPHGRPQPAMLRHDDISMHLVQMMQTSASFLRSAHRSSPCLSQLLAWTSGRQILSCVDTELLPCDQSIAKAHGLWCSHVHIFRKLQDSRRRLSRQVLTTCRNPALLL